jgi:hypothetical protein
MATKAEEQKARKTELNISRGMLIVVILGLAYTVGHDFFQGRSDDRRFGNIETALRILTQATAPQIYKSVDDSLNAALIQNKDDAAKALNNTQAHIKQLQDLKVSPDAAYLMQSTTLLQNVVSVHSDLPETWQAAVQMVDYKFQASASVSTLPNCLDTVVPNAQEVDSIVTPTGAVDYPSFSGPQSPNWMAHLYLGHCTLSLDDNGDFYSTSAGAFFQKVKEHHPQASFFFLVISDAHITYSGGKILPVSGIQFTNCTFDFKQPSGVPSKLSQSMTTQLLAANTSYGTIQLPAGI